MIDLKSGALSAKFDPALGMLRYVSYNGVEVVRGVYAAVRDENWGTYSRSISDLQVSETSVRWIDDTHPVRWVGIVEVVEGGFDFSIVGTVKHAFETKRTGVCVLHPRTVAGLPCTVEHDDGSLESGHFPDQISPDQPFFDVRSITHPIRRDGDASAPSVQIRFEGEIFEMEDQRNWSDASFKTYCRPHSWPSPYRLEQGERIEHRIRIQIDGADGATEEIPPAIAISVGEEVGPLPELGVWYLGQDLESLRSLPIRFLLVPFSGDPELVEEAAEVATSIGVELEVHVSGGNARDIEELERHASIRRFHVTDDRLLDELRSWALRGEIGPGTGGNFTELNRNRPALQYPFVSYATHAQIHAFDDASIVESVEGLFDTVTSARSFSNHRPVRVGPVRFGPTDDPRAQTPFGVSWTLAAIKQLAEAGAASVAVEHPEGLTLLNGIPLEDRKTVRKCFSSSPLLVQGLCLGSRLLLISLSAKPETVDFKGATYMLEPFQILTLCV